MSAGARYSFLRRRRDVRRIMDDQCLQTRGRGRSSWAVMCDKIISSSSGVLKTASAADECVAGEGGLDILGVWRFFCELSRWRADLNFL